MLKEQNATRRQGGWRRGFGSELIHDPPRAIRRIVFGGLGKPVQFAQVERNGKGRSRLFVLEFEHLIKQGSGDLSVHFYTAASVSKETWVKFFGSITLDGWDAPFRPSPLPANKRR